MNKADVEISVGIVDNVDKALDGVQSKLSKLFDPNKFAGWAMSIMFFGMGLQRLFDTIWKNGTKAFQDVMHSVEGTVTQFDILNGSIKYLQFNIGQALEPIVMFLIPIIDAMSELINQYPELTKWITVLGIALGTLFFVGGSGVLAINGFLTLALHLGLFTTAASGALVPTVALSTALKGISFVAVWTGIALVSRWIVDLGTAMGGFGEFMKSWARGLLRVFVLIFQGVVDLLIAPLNLFIGLLNKALEASNNLLGTNFKPIKTVSTTGILEKYMNWEENSFLAPSKGYAEFGGTMPQYQQQSSITNNFYGYTGDDVLKAANANR